jgi:hypothetical protein
MECSTQHVWTDIGTPLVAVSNGVAMLTEYGSACPGYRLNFESRHIDIVEALLAALREIEAKEGAAKVRAQIAEDHPTCAVPETCAACDEEATDV